MSREILDITPSGGLFCPVRFDKNRLFNCARPNGYKINDLLEQIRLNDSVLDNAFLTDGDVLRWALSLCCGSNLGRKLAVEARFNDWMIMIEDRDDGPSIDADKKCLTLSRGSDSLYLFAHDISAQMTFLFDVIRGLRVIWQENAGISKPDHLTAEDRLMRARIIEADADLCSCLFGYELKTSGYPDFWRYLLSGDLSTIAVALCECLDFDATPDGVLDALGFVFQDWYLNQERLAEIDHRTLCQLDDMAADSIGLEIIKFDDVIQISTLPDGFSYLEYIAGEFMTDDFYCHIADDANRAHLKQIVAEASVTMIEDIGFRDATLARKFFPTMSTYETTV